jgi:hypothetical protein
MSALEVLPSPVSRMRTSRLQRRQHQPNGSNYHRVDFGTAVLDVCRFLLFGEGKAWTSFL